MTGELMQLIDPTHPAYRNVRVRALIVAVCLGWAGVEFFGGDPFWGVLSGAAGIYAFYMLFWTFKPQPPAEEKTESAEPVADGKDPE
ncbi:hypothetical protein J2X43_002379 [Rhizobium sp. BE258]|nr:hypothetical protein [Rhizobium sp. BE258]